MSTSLSFSKWHGCGNDFVIVEDKDHDCFDWASLSRKLLDRRLGVGGDQLLVVAKPSNALSESADFRMRIFNPDSSESEMCGNGVRCFAGYVLSSGLGSAEELRVETLGGLKRVRVLDRSTEGRVVCRVRMGVPIVTTDPIKLCVEGKQLSFFRVDMGNPHVVAFVDTPVDSFPLHSVGPAVEQMRELFPNRTNVEIVNVIGDDEIRVRVWERGAGLTLACGTGACASFAAARIAGKIKGTTAKVVLPGGTLDISWPNEKEEIEMTGPGVEVFKGKWTLSE